MTPVQEGIRTQSISIPNNITTTSNNINNAAPHSPIQFSDEITLGEYIFYRIHQSNPKLKSIFGIPGDFNVDLLEHVYSPLITSKGIKFINTCNELNGAYAADGYSRVIQGLSVFISTFGVGELSAINGIAGAFAEFSPVLHIVGTTSLKQQQESKNQVINIHHLVPSKNALNAPNHNVYKRMVEDISVIQETLDFDMSLNMVKIDKVLKTIINESRPGYLFLPFDLPNLKIKSSELFMNPFNSNSIYDHSSKSIEILENATDLILEKLYQSKSPSILSDCLTTRFGFQNDLNKFINKLPEDKIKLFTSNVARNLDETKLNYIGVYNGIGSSNEQVKNELENSDFLLILGYFETEMNSGGYTSDFSHIPNGVIIHPDFIRINKSYIPIKQLDGERLFTIGDLINSLNDRLDITKLQADLISLSSKYYPPTFHQPSDFDLNCVSQDKLVDHFNEFLEEDDLFIVETMSFCFGLPDVKFAKNVQLLASNFYGSIGYAIPATFGATMAINDLTLKKRIILVQGDGAAQMTVQELSSFVRYQEYLPNMPQIYLINNDGYAIERKIKGPFRSYNDINGLWKWCDLLNVFGGGSNGKMYQSYLLKNLKEFENHFEKKTIETDQGKLQFYEIIAGKLDVPSKVDSMMCKK
ncbi:unnamed protein product [Candida verbasci]|uniref:Pyruvate decarboxylase n=1 Tax=Candida verbasci TaxID=1227364 RepID=A0A9W4TQY9_9ASCO|nr:unnamed protein product [Candida verbasci]